MRRFDRRRLLRLGGLGAAGLLAGCTGAEAPTDPPEDGSPTGTAEPDTAAPGTTAGGEVPGADMAGGPDDLQGRVEVRATVLESDQGAGRFVFTPAVAWVETGATVAWSFEEVRHTATVYHPDNDVPQRVPDGMATPFDSAATGAGDPGTSFNFVFDSPGVYNYFCRPHHGLGMVGLVIVSEPGDGPGTTDPGGDLPEAAASHLRRQLRLAGIL